MRMNTPSAPRTGKIPYSLILIAAVAAGLGLWLGQSTFSSPTLPALKTLQRLDAPRPMPAFALKSADGTLIDQARLQGHYTLVFLGFTHCPDICPTTLAELAKVEKAMGDVPEAQRPRILFVSVDPERDTPELIARYAAYFSPSILSGTADVPALTQMASAMSMVFAKAPTANGDYSIDHTSWVAVLDPQVRVAGFIRPPLDPAAIAADLHSLIKAH